MKNSSETGQARVLSGIKVVDFSRLLPGPWCAQVLGDLGAEVIKVEQPETGDYSRHNPPSYAKKSVYYNSVNSGKRCIALDLGRAEGRAVAQRLLAQADVVLESYRPGVAERLEVDYERAKALNPGVVYCSITGYGQTGPLAAIPGHDLVIQSMTGLMGMTLDTDPVPPVPGFQAADYAAAAMAPTGILAALMRRQQTGEGCYIDLSMFDSLFFMCNIVLTGAMARQAGQSGRPMMEVWGGNPRYATYPTQDGKVVAVSLLEARVWEHFCRHIGRPDLIHAEERPEHRHTDHGERAELYREAIAAFCRSKPRDPLVAEMAEADVPILAIYTPEEALAQPNVAARGLVAEIDDPVEGRVLQLVNPLARAGLAAATRDPAPELGQHNANILAELGYTEEERKRLHDAGAVG